jgi:adenine-specific DNA-methyltransferase
MARAPKAPKAVDALKHDAATRRNIPTAEMESFFRREEDVSPMPAKHYPRARPLPEGTTRTEEEPSVPEIIWNGARIMINAEQMAELTETGTLTLSDAQLVWRGKDKQDWSDLVVNVPPLYIQEKIHPKAIIDDLKRRTAEAREATTEAPDLFADFNGIEPDQRAEFYQHDQHWSNRMILGDSLQVMASLAERESLRGKVQCIYFDPPYGIKFNSNWQVSTQSRDVKDGKQTDISREPEQVKAFRDTWKNGIHSYLTYLRDRLTVMRDLLTESGSIFVQISEANVHLIRSVLDDVFGSDNFCSQIAFQKTTGSTTDELPRTHDFILFFCKNKKALKFRKLYQAAVPGGEGAKEYKRVESLDGSLYPISKFTTETGLLRLPDGARIFATDSIVSKGGNDPDIEVFTNGKKTILSCKPNRHWKTNVNGIKRLWKIGRLLPQSGLRIYKRYFDDFPYRELTHVWSDTRGEDDASYVVQTDTKVVERCILMASDPGDLVLDATCGSGTTAYVAEQWGRRWITIDTSRVALALARTRLMSAQYAWYLLADSREGRSKEAELSVKLPSSAPVAGDLRQGFVYERAAHLTLGEIANSPLIDDIWSGYEPVLRGILNGLNHVLGTNWEEWQVPRELPEDRRSCNAQYGVKVARQTIAQVDGKWPSDVWKTAGDLHDAWWKQRIARQREIDASIAARADVEYLYDKPYADPARVRVAGPFTVESLSPHLVLPASEEELIETLDAAEGARSAADADLATHDFAGIVIDYLKAEGVKQQAKGDGIIFESIAPWPGDFIGAAGTFIEGGARSAGPERRAAILIGPEYGTVGRQDLVAAAREAVDNRFDVLIACAFNFDAHSSELGSLGGLTILKARINPDMHMSEELKNTGRGNMFVVFGEPDVDVLDDGGPTLRVKVNGVDVFDPNTGDIRSSDTSGIAAWFIDTDYDEESFFVRHAYFLGANDPYKSLKTALQAEIDEDAWATLYSDTSRPFERPKGGRIAVKVINHFGDEVMKVFGV